MCYKIFQYLVNKAEGVFVMNCNKCGASIQSDSIFCSKCGSEVDNSNVPIENPVETPNNQPESPAKKTKKGLIIGVTVVIATLAVAAATFFITADSRAYNEAIKKYNTNDYDAAILAFQDIQDYNDSAEMVTKSYYAKGIQLLNEENYSEALEMLRNCGEFSDTADQIIVCQYELGKQYIDREEWDRALDILYALDHQDSQELYDGTLIKKEMSSKADLDFLKSLSDGLNLRWDEGNENTSTMTDVELGDYYGKLVNYEAENVYGFEQKEFYDQRLKKLASDYIAGLKTQEEALKYITVSYIKYSELWSEGYDARSIALAEISKLYKLDIDPDNAKTLTELQTKATIIQEEAEQQAKVRDILTALDFKLVENSYGYKTYETVAENTTDIDFEYFELYINLYSSDDVLLETAYSNINNWKQGQKARFQFTTPENFETMDFTASYR